MHTYTHTRIRIHRPSMVDKPLENMAPASSFVLFVNGHFDIPLKYQYHINHTPFSSGEAIEESSNLASFVHHFIHIFGILKVAPFLLPNARVFFFVNHLHTCIRANTNTTLSSMITCIPLLYYFCK